MAYDLEEQESIDQMKAWWDRWGTPVTSVVCVCCLAFAGWNGWNWWQRNQAAKASQIYAALQNAVATHDLKNVQSLSAGLISEYSSTLYAPLAAFASAQSASDAGDLADAKAKLNWVIEKSGRPEYDTVARVRLAGVLFDEGKLDEAAAVLAGIIRAAYRRGGFRGGLPPSLPRHRRFWCSTVRAIFGRLRVICRKLEMLGRRLRPRSIRRIL